MSAVQEASPYTYFSREQWRDLRKNTPQVLTTSEVEQLRGLGDNIDLDEVADVYLPLSRLISLRVEEHNRLHESTEEFFGEELPRVPFIIGVTGSVAAGKSTTARLLQVLLQRWESSPTVDLVTTDGFLYPTAELTEMGLLGRKGFPETYDYRALLRFISAVKSGQRNVEAPVYSHATYDRVPDEKTIVDQPTILIVEGLNILEPSQNSLELSDFLDFSIYVDAHNKDIQHWYIERFLQLKETAFQDPDAYFHHYATLSDEAAIKMALEIWNTVNLPNLIQHVEPTRVRADLVLEKGSDHSVDRVKLKKN